MKESSGTHKYQRDTFHGLFLRGSVSEVGEENSVILNKSHLCLGEVNERQRRSYLGCCFPLGTHKWVEIVHTLWHRCFTKQALPIWCCKQVKTNRIYCKHFLNHVCSGQKSSQHHMFTARLSVYAKSICFLTNAASIKYSLVTLLYILSTTRTNMMYPITACLLPQPSLPMGIIKGALSDTYAQLVEITTTWQTFSLFCVSGTACTTHHPSAWELWKPIIHRNGHVFKSWYVTLQRTVTVFRLGQGNMAERKLY